MPVTMGGCFEPTTNNLVNSRTDDFRDDMGGVGADGNADCLTRLTPLEHYVEGIADKARVTRIRSGDSFRMQCARNRMRIERGEKNARRRSVARIDDQQKEPAAFLPVLEG